MKALVSGATGSVDDAGVKVLLQRGAQSGYEVQGERQRGYRHV
jgi:hypothetical protein